MEGILNAGQVVDVEGCGLRGEPVPQGLLGLRLCPTKKPAHVGAVAREEHHRAVFPDVEDIDGDADVELLRRPASRVEAHLARFLRVCVPALAAAESAAAARVVRGVHLEPLRLRAGVGRGRTLLLLLRSSCCGCGCCCGCCCGPCVERRRACGCAACGVGVP